MIQKEICKFIESKTSFTLGPDSNLIYGHRETDATERCVLIAERSSGEADFYLPDKVNKIITVLARSESYSEASEDSDTIHNLLHGSVGWVLPIVNGGTEYFVQLMQSVGLPVYLGPDESGVHEFSCSYELKTQDN